jgi:hypothetical protein
MSKVVLILALAFALRIAGRLPFSLGGPAMRGKILVPYLKGICFLRSMQELIRGKELQSAC